MDSIYLRLNLNTAAKSMSIISCIDCVVFIIVLLIFGEEQPLQGECILCLCWIIMNPSSFAMRQIRETGSSPRITSQTVDRHVGISQDPLNVQTLHSFLIPLITWKFKSFSKAQNFPVSKGGRTVKGVAGGLMRELVNVYLNWINSFRYIVVTN